MSNMETSPLPPEFLSLMKSAGRAKFHAEMFASKIDFLTRQYSQGFDQILRQGANETRDEVIRDLASEMEMEVSSYFVKLEDFKAKLKHGSVDQDQDIDDSRSNHGQLPRDSLVGIQDVRDGMLQLQQQICNMECSNEAFQKRFEDATAQNVERMFEITARKKQLAEALESKCSQCKEALKIGATIQNQQRQDYSESEVSDSADQNGSAAQHMDSKWQPSACQVDVEQLENFDLEQNGLDYDCSKNQELDAEADDGSRLSGIGADPTIKLNNVKKLATIGELARGRKCPDCSKYFRSERDLGLHIGALHHNTGSTLPKVHVTKRNGKFECSVCKKLPLYSTRQGAEQHIIRVHTPSKLCPHCDGKFSSVSTLNRHIATKHSKTKRQAG